MGQVSFDLPEVGSPVETEEPKVRTGLSDLKDEINGNLDDTNIIAGANINGTKLANASVAAAKLTTDSVETAKIKDGNVTTAKLDNDAVTADKLRDSANTDGNRAVTTNHIRDGAVTTAKLSTPITGTATNDASVVTGTVTARRYTDGLVILEGGLIKGSGTWALGDTIATLPVGFRPAQNTTACVWVNAATGPTRITISTAGVISVTSGLLAGVAAAAIDCNGVVFQGA